MRWPPMTTWRLMVTVAVIAVFLWAVTLPPALCLYAVIVLTLSLVRTIGATGSRRAEGPPLDPLQTGSLLLGSWAVANLLLIGPATAFWTTLVVFHQLGGPSGDLLGVGTGLVMAFVTLASLGRRFWSYQPGAADPREPAKH
jgi:hypothetical protein